MARSAAAAVGGIHERTPNDAGRPDRSFSDGEEKQHLTVLVLEDDDADFRMLRLCLSRLESYRVEVAHAPSIEAASDLLRSIDFDLALVDYLLGQETVVGLLRDQGGRNSGLPLVLITGLSNRDVQTAALQAGAMGCLHKADLNSRILETTIRSVMHTYQLETQLYRANRAKTEFLAKISHDLKTPLNSIIGYSEAVATELLGPVGQPQYQEFATAIHTSALHLLNLIDNIIEQSLSENSQDEYRFAEVDVGVMVEAACAMLKPQLDGKKQRLSYSPGQEPLLVNGDRTRLVRAVVNLLSNAHKFSPDGSVIAVGLRRANGHVLIEVADQGIGMSRADVDLALTPYGRAALPTHLSQDGLGLGLPIVRQVVVRHRGKLEIESAPGAGTRITIKLPLLNPDG